MNLIEQLFQENRKSKKILEELDQGEVFATDDDIEEEELLNESIYTIDYVDNTGANFKERIKASSEEDALQKFNKKSKNFTNGVKKIKGSPYIDYLDDDDTYNEVEDDEWLNESYASLKNSLYELVKYSIEHHEYDLGRDWEDDDIVAHVERLIFEEPEKYAEAIEASEDMSTYEDFYNAILSDINEISNSRTESKKRSRKKVKEDYEDYDVAYDEEMWDDMFERLPIEVQFRLDDNWNKGSSSFLGGSRAKIKAYMTALLDSGLITQAEFDNFNDEEEYNNNYLGESKKKSSKKRVKESADLDCCAICYGKIDYDDPDSYTYPESGPYEDELVHTRCLKKARRPW